MKKQKQAVVTAEVRAAAIAMWEQRAAQDFKAVVAINRRTTVGGALDRVEKAIDSMAEYDKWNPNHRRTRSVMDNLDKLRDSLGSLAKTVLLLCLLVGTITAQAAPITEAQAVRAIIGEAAGEPYAGKLALAGALRNRATLKGVYGFSAKVLPPHTDKTVRDAQRAWACSLTNDTSLGATHWESKDFKVPYWAKSMTVTTNIGKHVFYTHKAAK